MIVLAKLLVLVGLIRLLIATDRPFLCSGLYASGVLALELLLGAPLQSAFLTTALAWLLASLYFWLLDRLQGGVLFWVVLIAGITLGAV